MILFILDLINLAGLIGFMFGMFHYQDKAGVAEIKLIRARPYIDFATQMAVACEASDWEPIIFKMDPNDRVMARILDFQRELYGDPVESKGGRS